jgi:hypothetical protein
MGGVKGVKNLVYATSKIKSMLCRFSTMKAADPIIAADIPYVFHVPWPHSKKRTQIHRKSAVCVLSVDMTLDS